MYRNQQNWIVGISLVLYCCYGGCRANTNLRDKPRDTSASVGQRVQLNCSTDDLKTSISWQYVSQGALPKDVFLSGILVNGYQLRFEMNGNSADGVYNLVILSVELSDAGIYRCRDKDGAGEHADAVLNVTATTGLVVKPRDTSASVGQRVQFNCSTSDLTTDISWQYFTQSNLPKDVYLGGRLVNGYESRFEVNGNRTPGVYNLVISSVQLNNAGTYRCRDKDGAGEHVDVSLNITENTDLRISPEHAEVQVGEKVQLSCITYYKTEPVNWDHISLGTNQSVHVYMNGTFVDSYISGYEVQVDITTGTNSLIITSAKLEDNGIYRCIEREGRGQQKDAALTVNAGQTEAYDSSTQSYSPEIEKSVTEKDLNLLWLLIIIPIAIAIGIVIYLWRKRKHEANSNKPQQEATELGVLLTDANRNNDPTTSAT